jgi:hypothetical protein
MPATPGDLSLAVGDGTRRMSYVELAAARGISLPAARRLVLRHKWPKHTANDGTVRVSMDLRLHQRSELSKRELQDGWSKPP